MIDFIVKYKKMNLNTKESMSIINNQTNAKIRLKLYNLKKQISLPPGSSRLSFKNNLSQTEVRFMLRIHHQTLKSSLIKLLPDYLYFVFLKSSLPASRLTLNDLYLDISSYPYKEHLSSQNEQNHEFLINLSIDSISAPSVSSPPDSVSTEPISSDLSDSDSVSTEFESDLIKLE